MTSVNSAEVDALNNISSKHVHKILELGIFAQGAEVVHENQMQGSLDILQKLKQYYVTAHQDLKTQIEP